MAGMHPAAKVDTIPGVIAFAKTRPLRQQPYTKANRNAPA
jgi:hypothetical protein